MLMTCTEFRNHNKSWEHLASLTRGVRSACVAHYDQCEGCQRWLEALPDENFTLPEAILAKLEVDQLALADTSDPEFHKRGG